MYVIVSRYRPTYMGTSTYPCVYVSLSVCVYVCVNARAQTGLRVCPDTSIYIVLSPYRFTIAEYDSYNIMQFSVCL